MLDSYVAIRHLQDEKKKLQNTFSFLGEVNLWNKFKIKSIDERIEIYRSI